MERVAIHEQVQCLPVCQTSCSSNDFMIYFMARIVPTTLFWMNYLTHVPKLDFLHWET